MKPETCSRKHGQSPHGLWQIRVRVLLTVDEARTLLTVARRGFIARFPTLQQQDGCFLYPHTKDRRN